MSYFALTDFPKEKPRCKAAPRDLNPKRVANRSELVGAGAVVFSENPDGNFLLKHISTNEQKSPRPHVESNQRKFADNNIFGPPIEHAKPARRVPGTQLPEDKLQQIYPPGGAEDPRIPQAQEKMPNGPTLVDKMLSYNYPVPRKEEAERPHVKRVPQSEFEGSEVEGFKGLGKYSKPARPVGVSMKVMEANTYVQDLPERKKQLSPRHRQHEVYNPINGERNPYYGQQQQQQQQHY